MCGLFLRFPQHIGARNLGRCEEKTSLGNICLKDANYSFTKELYVRKEGGERSRVQDAVVECRCPSGTPARQLSAQRLKRTNKCVKVHGISVRTDYS